MARRLRIEPRVSVENLEALYREARDPVARNQFQAIWLLAKGYPSEEVADLTGYTRSWVRKLAGRYNREGPEGLGDRRHRHPGARPILSEAQQRELYEALLAPHPTEGLWNSRLVAEWIYDKTGRKVHAQRGWAYLKRLGFSLQRPRPRHRQADGEAQDDFKKSSFWSSS